MSGTSTSPGVGAPPQTVSPPSLTRFALRHKRASLAVLAVIVAFAALLATEVAASTTLKVSDTTPCSSWSSARSSQQVAYARLYLARHGTARGLATPGAVQTAVDSGCVQAYAYDEADTVTVLQALRRQY